MYIYRDLNLLPQFHLLNMSATSEQERGESAAVDPAPHPCSTPGCVKPALMACPTCIKLGLPPARFCDQACFKGSWSSHKLVHVAVVEARGDQARLDPSTMPTEFESFKFTGPLRPYQKTGRRAVPRTISRPGEKNKEFI
jgi:hypothetical protein